MGGALIIPHSLGTGTLFLGKNQLYRGVEEVLYTSPDMPSLLSLPLLSNFLGFDFEFCSISLLVMHK
jgi:hypothetical protein